MNKFMVQLIIVGALIHSEAQATPLTHSCSTVPVSNNSFGSNATCGGLCEWEQDPSTLVFGIVCDLRDVCGSADYNAVEAVVNGSSGGFGDDDIVIRGQCDMYGTTTEFCCIFEDIVPEIENVLLFGTSKNDFLAFAYGTSAQLDQLAVTGAPKMNGRAFGLGGADRMLGSQISTATSYQETLNGGDGIDYIKGDNGPDILDGGNGSDFMLGWTHDDNIVGGNGNNVVVGGQGADTITTGTGDDLICGETASNVPLGIDKIWGPATFVPTGAQTYDPNTWGIVCTTPSNAYNDTIDAGAGNNRVEAGKGADEVITGAGADQVCLDGAPNGGVSDNIISGSLNADVDDIIFLYGTTITADIDAHLGTADNCSLTSGSRTGCELSTVSMCPF